VTLAVCSAIGIFAKRFELNRPAMLLAFILFSKIEALTFQTVSLYNFNSLVERPLFLIMCLFTLLIVFAGTKYVRNNKGEA
jgi:TctA family transporter